jgi:hypothetical protein
MVEVVTSIGRGPRRLRSARRGHARSPRRGRKARRKYLSTRPEFIRNVTFRDGSAVRGRPVFIRVAQERPKHLKRAHCLPRRLSPRSSNWPPIPGICLRPGGSMDT